MNERHIKFSVNVEVDLHNVGVGFSVEDAIKYLDMCINRGFASNDKLDSAKINKESARLISRRQCQCRK
jgi:hypothetical protein